MTRLTPPNSTSLERAVESLVGGRVGAIDTPLRKIWSAEDCPESLLPWLAWALSIDSWDSSWPVKVKRARVASAIAVQRRKGTVQSIRDVVGAFGGSIVLREWFESDPPATPHTFDLTLALSGEDGAAPSGTFIDQVIGEVSRTKPARSHFTFTIAQNAAASIGIVTLARPTIQARLDLFVDKLPDSHLAMSGDQAGNTLALSGDQQPDGNAALNLTVYF